jgi:hypothetical protein
MQHWIEHPSESGRLLLTWRAPETVTTRMRWAVAEVWQTDGEFRFRHLTGGEFEALNEGRSRQQLKEAGFIAFPPLPDEAQVYAGEEVLQALMRRLPPASRPDFPKYLAHHHIKHPTTMTAVQLLGATGAELPNDRFGFVDPLEPSATHLDCLIELHGFRHYAGNVNLNVEQELRLLPEPTNAYDPQAIRLTAGGACVGYVSRLQARSVLRYLEVRRVTAFLARLNGSPDRPRAFAMLHVRPR